MSVTTGLTPKFRATFSAIWFDGQQAMIIEFGLKLLMLLAVNPDIVVVAINLISLNSTASTTSLAIVSPMPMFPL